MKLFTNHHKYIRAFYCHSFLLFIKYYVAKLEDIDYGSGKENYVATKTLFLYKKQKLSVLVKQHHFWAIICYLKYLKHLTLPL